MVGSYSSAEMQSVYLQPLPTGLVRFWKTCYIIMIYGQVTLKALLPARSPKLSSDDLVWFGFMAYQPFKVIQSQIFFIHI